MVTVKQFLDSGFEFVIGDTILTKKTERIISVTRINLIAINRQDDEVDNDFFIESLIWRKNTGVQPVDDDCWVVIERYNGTRMPGMASEFQWRNNNAGCGFDIKQWKPYLKHLEQQMNDNQEIKTALEMSERDIVESDLVVWDGYGLPPVGIHCEYKMKHQPDTFFSKCFIVGLRNGAQTTSDEWLVFSDKNDSLYQHHTTRGVYDFRPIETPEQKAGRELFELSFKSVKHAGLTSEYNGDWGLVSEDDKKYWIHFAKQLGFTKGI